MIADARALVIVIDPARMILDMFTSFAHWRLGYLPFLLRSQLQCQIQFNPSSDDRWKTTMTWSSNNSSKAFAAVTNKGLSI